MPKHKKIFYCIILMFAVLGAGISAFSSEAQAATYYVATDGSDSNNGSISSPWATFNYAIFQVSTNDTIIAKAGTYNQSITVNKSGITLQGMLDANGNRLSIIDPYTNVSGGWTHIGDGVYTKNLNYNPCAMAVEIDGTRYKIPRLCQPSEGVEHCKDWLTHLKRPNTTTFNGWGTTYWTTINFWDGFEALFTVTSDGG